LGNFQSLANNRTKTYYAFEQKYPFLAENLISGVEIYPDPTKTPDKSAKIRAKWDTGTNHTVISVDLMKN
jgi:hypothetical protein